MFLRSFWWNEDGILADPDGKIGFLKRMLHIDHFGMRAVAVVYVPGYEPIWGSGVAIRVGPPKGR